MVEPLTFKYKGFCKIHKALMALEGQLGLPREDYQHTVIDEFLYMVACWALRTDACHWVLKIRST